MTIRRKTRNDAKERRRGRHIETNLGSTGSVILGGGAEETLPAFGSWGRVRRGIYHLKGGNQEQLADVCKSNVVQVGQDLP